MERYTKIAFSALLTMALLSSALVLLPEGYVAEREETRASTLYVGADQTYKTIKAAMGAASSGDTIRIYNGIYHEPLTISKSLTFQGNGSKNTIINQTTNEVTWWITAPGVVIKNIGFEANRSIRSWAIKAFGYNVSGGGRLHIEGCSFNDSYHGVDINVADNNKIVSSNFRDAQIHLGYSDSNTIKNLSMTGGSIFIDMGDDNLVEGCLVSYAGTTGTGKGVQVLGYRNLVQDCHLHDIDGVGIGVGYDDNIIYNNWVEDNTWGGIMVFGGDENLISNNLIRQNGRHGIEIHGSCNNTFNYNTIEDSEEYGIRVYPNSKVSRDNEVAFNNFIDNGGLGKQAYDYYELNNWNTAGGGNYWSDHNNIDFNNDQYADQTYLLDGEGGARDKRPFANRLVFPNPPKILTSDVTTAYTKQNYSVPYNVFDWDTAASQLIWTFRTNASWLTFTGSWVLKGLPTVSTSSYWVNLTVSDGSQTDFTNFTLQVINNNIAPKLTTTNLPICYEDQPYIVDYEAEDSDDLVWNMVSDAAFLSMDPSTGVLSGTPGNDDVGLYSVLILVEDEWSRDSTEFTLEVVNTNDPPIITTEDIVSVDEGDNYMVQYLAEDIDPTFDTMRWILLTNCPFMEMDADTGILSGTPGESDAGIYSINVTVSDGNGGLDTHVFDLEVVRVNNAPSARQANWIISMFEDGTDSSLNVNDMFSDIDHDELTFTISDGEHISWELSETGAITFEPSPDWVGTSMFTVSASDGEESASATVSIEVRNVNDPPLNPVIDKGTEEFKENGTQRVSASAFDLDTDDALTYEWFVEGMGLIGSGKTIDLNLPEGTYTLILRVSDISGEYVETSMQIVVLPVSDFIPRTEPSPSNESIVPYLIGASAILLAAALALSFFILRRRNQRHDDEIQGMAAWNQVFHDLEGPTPKKGRVPGSATAPQTHRLLPNRDLAPNGTEVNGGTLGGYDNERRTGEAMDPVEEESYMTGLLSEVLSSKNGSPPKSELLRSLEEARRKGNIPDDDCREIKRRLNNIDK